MNLFKKVTKTQFLLLFVTLCFFVSLCFLYRSATNIADGTDYTISAAGQSDTPVPDQATELIDINTASAEQLQTLPGIGATLARRIIDFREENGPFFSIEDLLDVKGIGNAMLDELRPLITASRP